MAARLGTRRRRLAGTALALGVASIACFLTPVSPASATDCGANVPNWTIRCDAGHRNATISANFSLSGWETQNGITISCTSAIAGSALDQTHSAPGRALPTGIEVNEPGSIGVSAGAWPSDYDPVFASVVGDAAEYGTFELGPSELSMTNWAVIDKSVTITIFCTTDRSRWKNVLQG
jgi:hypothetical protein